MANTDLSYYSQDVFYGGNFVIEWHEAGDSSIKAGYTVMDDGSDAGEIKVGSTVATSIFGVAGLAPTQEIDTVYTIGDSIPVHLCGSGGIVFTKHDGTSETLLKGRHMCRSDGVAGAIELWAYVDATEDSDSLAACIGRSTRRIATGGVAIFTPIILGL